MYFEPTPKDQKSDLFGFDQEYARLRSALAGRERLIVIKGLRRTGKTSLLKVAYNQLGTPKMFIDMREIVPRTQENFAKHFYLEAMHTIGSFDFLKNILGKIRSLEFGITLNIEAEENTLSLLLKNINEELVHRNKIATIFVDEAQLMKPILADNLFAYIYDHLKGIKMVFAGSEIGILDKMLEEEKNALFGRPYLEITLEPIPPSQAQQFLKTGFNQMKYHIPESDLQKIIEKTGGTMGWLTLAGYYVFSCQNLDKGLKKMQDIAGKIISSELNNFFENRLVAKRRYLVILKLLSRQPLRWMEIKRGFEAKLGKISNNKFTGYLHVLGDYGFVSRKDGGYYYIPDKLLTEYLGSV